MEKYILDGEKYYYKNGKWFDDRMCRAPLAQVSKLNRLLLNQINFESKTINELLEIIDGARAAENYQLAAQALEAAIRIATIPEIRQLLPRLTSNYRKQGRPRTAIDISKAYTDKYKKSVWSPALFTSVAAAYCDLEDYTTGRKFANLAMAISGGQCSEELISVYKRIKEAEK